MDFIDYSDFLKVDIATGTIISAALNPKANKPTFILTIDFGKRGTKTSSAQLTGNYTEEVLVGKQVVAAMNLYPKRIAGVKSEALVLAAVCPSRGTVLLEPTFPVTNGVSVL